MKQLLAVTQVNAAIFHCSGVTAARRINGNSFVDSRCRIARDLCFFVLNDRGCLAVFLISHSKGVLCLCHGLKGFIFRVLLTGDPTAALLPCGEDAGLRAIPHDIVFLFTHYATIEN